MTSTVEQKIRFATAAYAINATPKSLRNWLNRGQFGLPNHFNTRNWLSFSLVDIAMLAVTRKLVDFGVRVEEASRQAREAVLNPMFRVPYEKARMNEQGGEEKIKEVFRGLRYFSSPDQDYAFGWRTEIRQEDDMSLPADAVIVIALDVVIATALRRAREHLEGKATK